MASIPEIQKSSSLVRIASSLLFLSGMSALIYEVIWFKRFAHVYGSSTLAQAVVVTSFLFGLALGAFLFGRIADRVKSPLGWYCVCEILIGLLALVIPYELAALHRLSSALYPLMQDHPALHFCIRFMLTFVVIGPSCILLGGTLPLLLKHFLIVQPWNRETTGWLYAVNTIGAAFGAYAAGFYLLPGLGMMGANYLAVAINLYVAMLVFLLLRQYRSESVDSSPAAIADERPFPNIDPSQAVFFSARAIYAALLLMGCASLILQLVWTRQLALILGGTTYAFSSMLFVFLLGIGLGSLVYSRMTRRLTRLSTVLLVVVFLLILTTALGSLSIPYMSMAVGMIRRLRFNSVLNGLISVGVNSVLQLIPTLCMGFLFPLCVDILRWRTTHIGKVVGNVYAWNTAGSIAGTMLVPFLLLPNLGSNATTAAAMFLYMVSLLLMFPYARKKSVPALVIGVFCILLLIGLTSRPTDPRLTNMGQFMYGYLAPDLARSKHKVLYFKESTHSNVLVVETETNRHLRVNGKVDASDTNDMPMQLGLAYYPRMIHPEASDVLVIGYGSGVSAGASLHFPGTRVTCCEIEPAVVESGFYFPHVNNEPERSPYFTMILDDGRNYLKGCGQSFDLILSEPSNPWMAGIANLFTKEFYQEVKDRLKPNGIFTQWIHTYNLTHVEYTLIIRTLLDVFPHCALIRISSGDTLILVSEQPLTVDRDHVLAAQRLLDATPQVAEDIQRFFTAHDAAAFLLRGYVLPEEHLRRIVENDDHEQINTDMNMRLEFSAPLHLFFPEDWVNDINQVLVDTAEPSWIIERFQQWGCSSTHISILKMWIPFFQQYNTDEKAKRLIDFARTHAPDDPYLSAQHLYYAVNDLPEFERTLNALIELSPEDAFDIGVELHETNRDSWAAKIFERIVERYPTQATVWVYLARCYQKMGNTKLADEAMNHARELDPRNSLLLETDAL